jgi:YggT family protein
MLGDAAVFLIHTACGFFAAALILRFWMQATRASGRNPLALFVQSLTNFLVMPARRFIPGLWGLDMATLVVAWLTLVIEVLLILLVRGMLPDGALLIGKLAVMALLMLMRLSIYLAIGGIFVQVILSWVNPHSPIAPVVNAMTRPLLQPIQRIVPPIGMVDLSPLIALVLLQLILMVPLAYLEHAVGIII